MDTSLLDTRLLLQLVLYVSKGMLGLARPGLSTLYDPNSQLNLISNPHVERKVELSSIVRSLAPLKNSKDPDHRANEATWKGQLIPYFMKEETYLKWLNFTPVRSYDIIKAYMNYEIYWFRLSLGTFDLVFRPLWSNTYGQIQSCCSDCCFRKGVLQKSVSSFDVWIFHF